MMRSRHLKMAGFVIGGAVLLAAAVGVPVARAEDDKDRQIRELRERLERLEKLLGAKAEAPPTQAAAPAPGAPAAAAGAPQSISDRVKSIEETIKSVPLLSTAKDWNFGGHVAVSYNFNVRDPQSRNNAFRLFDEKSNQFDVNQAELYVEKPTSEPSPIGFGLDVLLGRDAKKVHSSGLGEADQPFDLTQAYVMYKVPIGSGLDLKGGKFVTLHGAEVIRRTGNFNISRSLGFTFAIPFTHTGVLATYPFTDWLSLTAGIVNGWDNTDDNNRAKSFHGAATVIPMKDLTLTLGGTWGAEQRFAGDTSNGPKRGLIDLVATYKPIAPLTLTLNYDYGVQEEAFLGSPFVPLAFVNNDKTARWHAIAAYAIYDVTDRISVGVRGEYFRDEQGFRLGFTDPVTGNPARLELWGATLTGRYKLFDHVYASAEFRHDEATDNKLVFDRGDGTKNANSQNTIQGELIYQF